MQHKFQPRMMMGRINKDWDPPSQNKCYKSSGRTQTAGRYWCPQCTHTDSPLHTSELLNRRNSDCNWLHSYLSRSAWSKGWQYTRYWHKLSHRLSNILRCPESVCGKCFRFGYRIGSGGRKCWLYCRLSLIRLFMCWGWWFVGWWRLQVSQSG